MFITVLPASAEALCKICKGRGVSKLVGVLRAVNWCSYIRVTRVGETQHGSKESSKKMYD